MVSFTQFACLTATECGRSSMLYLEWDGFVSYLECWTSSKTDPALRNIPAVVRICFCTHSCSLEGATDLKSAAFCSS